MPRDPKALIWDALHAAELIQSFVAGKSWTDYEDDVLLRSGVERQFEIVGEALNNMRRMVPEVAERVPDLPRIVAFRNVLIHGYATIDDRVVWQVAAERVEPLTVVLRQLLDETS